MQLLSVGPLMCAFSVCVKCVKTKLCNKARLTRFVICRIVEYVQSIYCKIC
jgi:hypothetical protein